jgi:hypothetical protein
MSHRNIETFNHYKVRIPKKNTIVCSKKSRGNVRREGPIFSKFAEMEDKEFIKSVFIIISTRVTSAYLIIENRSFL